VPRQRNAGAANGGGQPAPPAATSFSAAPTDGPSVISTRRCSRCSTRGWGSARSSSASASVAARSRSPISSPARLSAAYAVVTPAPAIRWSSARAATPNGSRTPGRGSASFSTASLCRSTAPGARTVSAPRSVAPGRAPGVTSSMKPAPFTVTVPGVNTRSPATTVPAVQQVVIALPPSWYSGKRSRWPCPRRRPAPGRPAVPGWPAPRPCAGRGRLPRPRRRWRRVRG